LTRGTANSVGRSRSSRVKRPATNLRLVNDETPTPRGAKRYERCARCLGTVLRGPVEDCHFPMLRRILFAGASHTSTRLLRKRRIYQRYASTCSSVRIAASVNRHRRMSIIDKHTIRSRETSMRSHAARYIFRWLRAAPTYANMREEYS